MKRITKVWLKKQDACSEGVVWYLEQKTTDAIEILNRLIKSKDSEKIEWANWTITKLFNREQRIKYACYAAKQVLKNFEKEYPDDKRPREAINSALKCIENNTAKNRSAARSAAWSAARSAAWSAAWSAARPARSAAWSAAWSAARPARSAAWSAAESARSAESAMKVKIIKYGIKLLKE